MGTPGTLSCFPEECWQVATQQQQLSTNVRTIMFSSSYSSAVMNKQLCPSSPTPKTFFFCIVKLQSFPFMSSCPEFSLNKEIVKRNTVHKKLSCFEFYACPLAAMNFQTKHYEVHFRCHELSEAKIIILKFISASGNVFVKLQMLISY